MHIKRKLKVNNRSKRKPVEEDEMLNNSDTIAKVYDEEEKDDYNKNFEKLKAAKNLKLFQNERLKKKGILIDKHSENEMQKQPKDEKEKKSLDKQFTKNLSEQEIEDVHVEAFIKEHLQAFFDDGKAENGEESEIEKETQIEKGKDVAEEWEKRKRKKIMEKEDSLSIEDLYKLPEHIRVQSSAADASDKLNCITGIIEVPLPAEVKLKNIQETEKMKRKLLKKAKIIKIKHS